MSLSSGRDEPHLLARHSLSPGERKKLLAVERVGDPFLAIRDDQGELRLIVLGSGGPTKTLGRRTETDVSIPWDDEVSGLHAELQCLAGEWLILDDGLSTNGTYVNGQRVGGRLRLRDGDRIRVGRTVLVFGAAHARPAGTTTPATKIPSLPQLTDTQRRVLVALCRPYGENPRFATPASNQQIADEVFLSVDAVKMHLRSLFQHFELGSLPQNKKRATLAERALTLGLVAERDLTQEG
ncbi:MAG TPA: FHA domain-containing protein [Solirubrobacteraceae bacterium]|nr:FHA domain-containing protein [Solirubrobacteraceae bacterium]